MLSASRRAEQFEPFRTPERELTNEELDLGSMYAALEESEKLIPQTELFRHVPLPEKTKDILLARNLENQYRWNGTERGRILESFLAVEIGRSSWLGDAEVFCTTEFDDYKNGVDLVLEWLTKDGRLVRLAVDLTTSEEPENLAVKLQKSCSLADIKYFRTEKTRDSSIVAPLVVLGIDASLLQEIAKFAESRRKLEKKSGQRVVPVNAFAMHPLKYLLLKQAVSQLNRAAENPAGRHLKSVEAVRKIINQVWQDVQEEMKDPEISRGILAFKRRSVLHKVLTTGRLP